MKKATNLIDVRDGMLNTWNAVNGPKPDLEKIAQQNNTAGKLLAFAAIDLKASIYMKLKPDMAFLGIDEKARTKAPALAVAPPKRAANSATLTRQA